MIERDRSIVESELVKLIYFLADPKNVPAHQRRFQFRHNQLEMISKAEARRRSQHPWPSAPTAARGAISA